LVYPGTG